MKLNVRNLTNENKRLRFIPRSGAVATLPEEVSNPTLGKDDDGSVSFCLAPKPVITCVGARNSAMFQLFMGMSNNASKFRLRARVNDDEQILHVTGDGPWYNFFAFNANLMLRIDDVVIAVYPYQAESGAYSYYMYMQCQGSGEKRVQLLVDELDPNTNIQLPIIECNNMGLEFLEDNPTMSIIEDGVAHACLIPQVSISCIGATDQSGCIDLGDGDWEVAVNSQVVLPSTTGEALKDTTIAGIEATECHELTPSDLAAFRGITPNFTRTPVVVNTSHANSPTAKIRYLSKLDESTNSLTTRFTIAVDNYPEVFTVITPSSFPANVTEQNPVQNLNNNFEVMGENGVFLINVKRTAVKQGARFGWEFEFSILGQTARVYNLYISFYNTGGNLQMPPILTPSSAFDLNEPEDEWYTNRNFIAYIMP